MKNQDVREAAILEIYEIADELSKEKDSPYFKIWKICNDALKQIEPEVIPDKMAPVYYEIIIPKEEPKQETLEKVAKKQWGNVHRTGVLGFIDGVKSDAARDYWLEKFKAEWYNEEEVRKLLIMQRGNSYVAILTKTKDEELARIASTAPEPGGKDGWVKQFKKK